MLTALKLAAFGSTLPQIADRAETHYLLLAVVSTAEAGDSSLVRLPDSSEVKKMGPNQYCEKKPRGPVFMVAC
jgi:hypothetical protein